MTWKTSKLVRLSAIVSVLIWGLGLGGGLGPAVAAETSYANPELLIETKELADLLDKPGVRIIDLRRDKKTGEAAYREAHIPGAIYLSRGELDDAKANAEGFPIRPEKAAALFSGLGIDADTTVIAYDDFSNLFAARLFFVLDYYGHTKTRVLNGGLAKWQQEKRSLTSDVPTISATKFVPRAQRDAIATADDVKAGLGKADVALIDARSPAEYDGTDKRAKRGGHIPGAQNVNYAVTLAPNKTFKSADELRKIFEAAGARPDRQMITYCQSGTRAAHEYFALRLLGYTKIKNYDGSWKEWGDNASLPIKQ